MSETVLSNVSRRRVIAGAAWATPAILIAAGSPPAAASVTNGTPILTGVMGAYSPNNGNSAQTITATMNYSPNGTTTSIVLTAITITFVKQGGNDNQASGGEIQSAGWQIDTADSVFPKTNGAVGKLVLVPNPPGSVVLSSANTAVPVNFNINRFSSISSVKFDGTAGTTSVTFTYTP